MIDGSFLLLLAVLVALAGLAVLRGGAPLLASGLSRGAGLLGQFGLLLVVSFLAAGLAEVLVPVAWVRAALGPDSGLRGLLVGTVAGALTPAGPFTAMPLAAVFLRAGAAPPAVVAYLVGWSLLALHRVVAWEVPILGPRLALLRYGVCLALPVLAGLAARLLLGRT